MNKHCRLCIFASSVLLLLASLVLPGCSDSAKPAFASIDITGANYATNFELTDHNGKLRHLEDFSGKVVVMFFGYTQCPDVCPTTMADLAQVKRALGKDGDRLQGLFVTVDPQRDTPQVLKAYMENFDPTFLALYASPEKLVELAKTYKVYFKKVEGSTATSYTVDHSAGSYVYDTKGRLRLFTRYGSGPKLLAQDIALLLKESS
jgi:protein SCO1/2